MQKKAILFLYFFFLFFLNGLFPQTVSKKAAENYSKANQAFTLSDYDKALEYCRQAIKQETKYDKPYLLMTDIYVQIGKKDEASKTLQQMLEQGILVKAYIYLLGAKLEQELGRYNIMQHYLDLYEIAADQDELDAWTFDLLKNSHAFSVQALQNPVDFVPENLGASINTEYDEYLPCMTVDGEIFIFTRRLSIENQVDLNTEQEDFFISQWKNNAWTVAIPLGTPINTEYNEGAGTISADGRILIFTACAGIGRDYGAGREGFGSCDLFYSFKEGDRWSVPQNLGPSVNSSQWESQPSLSADGRTLYFIRGDRTKSNSGDIYVSSLGEDNRWKKSQKLPDNINSKGKEHSVFIHPNGKTLYFSSNGHPGMGGFDIFVTTKINDSIWTDPINLGYPINTYNDENSIMVSSDGHYGYFAANRDGGFGKMDIYRFEMPQQMRSLTVNYLKGKVFDSKTLYSLLARFELIDLQTNEIVFTSYSDKIDGTFLVALPAGKNYALNVFAPGYLFYSDNFQMQENTVPALPFEKEIPLQKIEVGESTILRNIFFDFDKSDLQPESQTELMKLVGFLQKNSSLCIEIEGYTDNKGDDDYNQKLSEARAKAVLDYLVSKGIAMERLSYKGYGSLQPVETNDTEKGRAANRRTEIRIMKNEK